MSPAGIQAEYERRGGTLGWRFLTCPAGNLHRSRVALITLNPGGSTFEPPLWSVEEGSAYELEVWTPGCLPGREPLQRQVQRMLALVPVRPAEVLSGYFIPFRSPDIARLPQRRQAFAFGAKLWEEVLGEAPQITLLLAFGTDTAARLAALTHASLRQTYPAGWGSLRIKAWDTPAGRRIVGVPHLSRFRIFGRASEAAEAAFRQALL